MSRDQAERDRHREAFGEEQDAAYEELDREYAELDEEYAKLDAMYAKVNGLRAENDQLRHELAQLESEEQRYLAEEQNLRRGLWLQRHPLAYGLVYGGLPVAFGYFVLGATREWFQGLVLIAGMTLVIGLVAWWGARRAA